MVLNLFVRAVRKAHSEVMYIILGYVCRSPDHSWAGVLSGFTHDNHYFLGLKSFRRRTLLPDWVNNRRNKLHHISHNEPWVAAYHKLDVRFDDCRCDICLRSDSEPTNCYHGIAKHGVVHLLVFVWTRPAMDYSTYKPSFCNRSNSELA